MKLKFIAFAFLICLFSCNGDDKKTTDKVNTETTTDDHTSGNDIEAQKKALNQQSKACIALMNSLEQEMNAAYAAGNSEAGKALQARIDSAATENAKIGQQLMALDNK